MEDNSLFSDEEEQTPEQSFNLQEDFYTRLQRLEDTISRLEFAQDSCRPLLKLSTQGNSLTKLNDSITNMVKRCSDIQVRSGLNQEALKVTSAQYQELQESFQESVQTELNQRQKQIRDMTSRLFQVENSFKQIEEDNRKAITTVQNKLKEEIKDLVDSADFRLRAETSEVQEILNKSKSEVQEEIQKVNLGLKAAEDRVTQFETKYSLTLQQGSAEGSQQDGDQPNYRNQLLEQIDLIINESINSCRQSLDKRYINLSQKYTSELLRMKGQIELLRQWIRDKRGLVTAQTPPEVALKEMNIDFSKILESLRDYSQRAFENLFESCNTLAEDIVGAYDKRRELEGQDPSVISETISKLIIPIQNKAKDVQEEVKILNDTTDTNISRCEEFVKKGQDSLKQVANIGEAESSDRKNIAKRETENYRKLVQEFPKIQRQLAEQNSSLSGQLNYLKEQLESLSKLQGAQRDQSQFQVKRKTGLLYMFPQQLFNGRLYKHIKTLQHIFLNLYSYYQERNIQPKNSQLA